MRLAAIILTYNEAKHVADCIETLRFADPIIVFDLAQHAIKRLNGRSRQARR